MFKAILGLIASILFSSSFAQNSVVFTMRVEDKIGKTFGAERFEYNRASGTTNSYDVKTHDWLGTVTEFKDGRGATMTSPIGGSVMSVLRPIRDLKSGEETSGKMKIAFAGIPPMDIPIHVKATKRGDLTIVETVGGAPGYVIVFRVAYATDYYDPTWSENIIHIQGRKILHDHLTRLR